MFERSGVTTVARRCFTALVLGITVVAPVVRANGADHGAGPYKKVQPLLAASSTVMDEKLLLPDASPLQVASTIVTIDPGEETAWHKHGVPLFIYILSGEVTVDYGERGTRTFGPGGSFVEAMDVWHRGTNRGAEPVRILTVSMGPVDAPAVIPKN